MMKFFCKKIKMKNNFIKLIAVFIIIFLTGCNSLKEGLEGNKKSKNAEEFLIEKKNPLTVPPDMNELPVPLDQEDENLNENEEEIDIKKVLINNESEDIDTDIDDEGIDDLEKSIIEKIND